MAIDQKLARDHQALLESLDLMIGQTSDPELCERSAPAVSGWCVKEHLEHLAIANGGIASWIERALVGDPKIEKGGEPSFLGRIVLVTGVFPRGRGQAPEHTRPTGMSVADLHTTFGEVRHRFETLGASLGMIQVLDATRNHFVFGDLNAAQWLRFMVIHNNHHQKIIRDVLAAH